jgi:hypothetical protein
MEMPLPVPEPQLRSEEHGTISEDLKLKTYRKFKITIKHPQLIQEVKWMVQ